MSIRRLLLTALFLLSTTIAAQAQLAIYRDSTTFDDAFGRLRDIDFEDVYSTTVQNILFRNPYGLHTITDEYPDEEGNYSDTVDISLELAQGATLDFPTRTRTVQLHGYANPFYTRVIDFNDSMVILPLDTLPLTISMPTGIARIQFLGTDGNGNDDVNWRGGLTSVVTFDEHSDTLASTDFDELEPDRFYFLGQGYDANAFFADESLLLPIDYHGVTITEPTLGFLGTHLSSFEARVDPDNPIGNLSLEMASGGTIDFRNGVEGVLLVVEQVHERDTLVFEVTTNSGSVDTVMETGWSRVYDTAWVPDQRTTYLHLGFGSSDGIRQIKLLYAWMAAIEGDPDAGFPYDTVYYERTAMLTAVHLAETVPMEIVGITNEVTDLDSAGYVEQNESEMMHTPLAAALAKVEANDRPGAIAQLNAFRSNVGSLLSQGQLVPEEAQKFERDAAYVITRLAGVSGVANASRTSAVSLGTPHVSNESVNLDFTAPEGSAPLAQIVDMQGRIVREIAPATNTILWDLRDEQGARVPAGVYLIVLNMNGSIVSPTLSIAR